MPAVKGKKKAASRKEGREVISEEKVEYDILRVNGVPIPVDTLRVSVADAKKFLGWETEMDFFERKKKDNPNVTPKDCEFGSSFLLKDLEGAKVNCWHNSKNRPLTESWCVSLMQDILQGHWRFNSETIIVSRTGQVLSGQHRLIALVLAVQEWEKNGLHWQAIWPGEPYIETLLVTGADETQETINTLDNVRTRTLSDVFYTSSIFATMRKDQRKKASDMLDNSVDFLWRRTLVSREGPKTKQTHSASIDFLNRHKTLLDCIHYILGLDDKNSLSRENLYVGKCAAVLYLMASSDTSPDEYMCMETPSEDCLDWEQMEKAKRFWQEIADDTAILKPLREALHALRDEQTGKDSRIMEKLCCIAKAWALFKEDMAISVEGIMPIYDRDNNTGIQTLADWPTFGGIDFGEPNKANSDASGNGEEEELSEEELERRKREAKAGPFREKVRRHKAEARN